MKEKIKIILMLSILIIFIAGAAFYWYEWKPSKIRSQCNAKAVEIASLGTKAFQEVYDFAYKSCLRKYGIKN